MKTSRPILALAVAAFLLAGCQLRPDALLPEGSTKYSIESTGKFVWLDSSVQAAVICTGLQEHVGSEGRLAVVANVMNRENRRIQVQVRCVFKDDNGFSTGDETPWQTLNLDQDATEAVHFTATNNLAHKYTIAVRAVP